MNFAEIEPKWMKFWEEHRELYRAKSGDKDRKKYVLVEFPYPSGSGLHVGHAFSFTAADIYARFKRMQGYNVMFPMGWDAFGLPTENYAIKMKRKPQEVTKENTDMFRSQMKKLAFSFDWEREINTTDPNYYKWTQWIFIQLFKKGLAYKKEMPINWCPSCKIGLANEEVVNGKCERCGVEVSRRNISQWVVKITDYAERLLDGLKNTNFIDKVKTAQVNWIGKSEGARIKFQLSADSVSILSCSRPSSDVKSDSDDCARKIDTSSAFELEVFTTRPDTIYGATFMVVAPEHPIVSGILACDEFLSCSRPSSDVKSSDDCARKNLSLRQNIDEIKRYVVNARKKSDMERTELGKEKTGVFSGLYAINPVAGKEIPIWISDFVLGGYGTGAIMSVPAHDERDMEFAKKYGLPIVEVFNDKGLAINSEELNGMTSAEATKKMIERLAGMKVGERANSYHLRDWIFSRQHYWGEPIPMIWCEKDKWQPVPEDQLPVVLPEVDAYEPTEDGKSPLSKIESFVKCKCPVCGGEAKRETDTMPNWAGSDWYYLSYLMSTKCKVQSAKLKKGNIFNENENELKYWMPVDVYIGGDEHNTLHLLYSRFIYQFLWDLGVVPKEIPEPYIKRVSHGVILGADNQRMSKSKGNVIVPEKVTDVYGVDVIRCYLMFMGPFDAVMAWNENTLMGVKRFLDRFEKYVVGMLKHSDNKFASNEEYKVIINKMIKGVTDDLEDFGYNTAIAKMMEGLNKLQDCHDPSGLAMTLGVEEIKILIKLIAPFVPYLSEELWSLCGEKGSVHSFDWPVAEEKYLIEKIVTVVIAINGKVRDEIRVEADESEESIVEKGKKTEKIRRWLEGKKIVKEIYVPGKGVNLVVAE